MTSAKRIAGFPQVAAIEEGLPGFVATNKSLPPRPLRHSHRAITRLNGALRTVLSRKELIDAYLAQGALVEWTSADEITSRITRDISRWRALAKEASVWAR